jgi:WD40 repeat protein
MKLYWHRFVIVALSTLAIATIPSAKAQEGSKPLGSGPWITSIDVGPGPDDVVATSATGLLLRAGSIQRASINEPQTLQQVVETPSSAWKIALLPDKQRFIATDYSGGVHLGSLSDPASTKKLETATRWSRALLPLEDGRVLIGTEDGKVVAVQTNDGTAAAPADAHGSAIFSLRRSKAGTLIASSSGQGSVKLWNATDLQPVREIAVGPVAVWDTAFAKEDSLLVTGDADRRINLYDVASGKLLQTLAILPDWITSLVSLPNDFVAAGCMNGKVYFFDLQSKSLVHHLDGPGSGIWALSLCGDGNHLIAGTRSHGLHRWDAPTWTAACEAGRAERLAEVPPAPAGR